MKDVYYFYFFMVLFVIILIIAVIVSWFIESFFKEMVYLSFVFYLLRFFVVSDRKWIYIGLRKED